MDFSRLFIDSNEKQIATLGGSYINNFLQTGTLDNGFCAVSDKRVYFRGKCYVKSGRFYRSSKEERTVDLKDITGSGFSFTRNIFLLIIAIIGTPWSLFALSIGVSDIDHFAWSAAIFTAWLPTIIAWVAYAYYNVKIFEITYAGGRIAFKASNYTEEETQAFQKSLRMAKDNYSSVPSQQSSGSVGDELKKYKDLLDSGAITQEEFDNLKKRSLGLAV